MKISRSTDASAAPQRRNRGSRIRIPVKVSPTHKARVNGILHCGGTRNSSTMCDQPNGSVIFQMPEERKRMATTTAATCPATVFQAGISKLPPSRRGMLVASICIYCSFSQRRPAHDRMIR